MMPSEVVEPEPIVVDTRAGGADADRTAWFASARVGVMFHWGLHALLARGAWAQHRERIAPEAYARLADRFVAGRWRPESWAEAARAAGAGYVVLPAKGCDGFALFHSAFSEFTVRQTPLARDALRDVVDACRAADLRIGLAYALLDWHHPDHPVDELHPLRGVAREGDVARYLRQVQGQVRELMANYGRIDLLRIEPGCEGIVADGWPLRELAALAVGAQPQVLLTGAVLPPDGSDLASDAAPSVAHPRAREVSILLGRHHGYARDEPLIDAETLWRRVVDAAAGGANALIHVGVDAHGQVPTATSALLRALGERMAAWGEAVAGCGDAGLGRPAWGRWTRGERALYAHVWDPTADELPLPELAQPIAYAWSLDDGADVPLRVVDGVARLALSRRRPCVVAIAR